MKAAEEDFQARYDRIHAQWTVLAKRMRAWANAQGHSMGPLHAMSTYNRIEHTRRASCRRCHFHLWVKLTGEMQGLPSYRECPVAREQREYQERMSKIS